jgi:hypothetical protein
VTTIFISSAYQKSKFFFFRNENDKKVKQKQTKENYDTFYGDNKEKINDSNLFHIIRDYYYFSVEIFSFLKKNLGKTKV